MNKEQSPLSQQMTDVKPLEEMDESQQPRDQEISSASPRLDKTVPPSQEKKIILIMGIRGTGKSTKAKELLTSRPRVLIYDTLCEYRQGLIVEDIKSLCETWRKLHGHDRYAIIYQPINPVADFAEVCELVYLCGEITFFIEEIDTFLSINPAGICPEFLNIVQRGRHYNIELIGVTQRPYALPAILRSQCKELYSFRQFEERDIQWLKAIIGQDAEGIRELKQFEFMGLVDGNVITGKTKKV